MIPYAPDDILALRSYVATGGSLLVVVSPGWEPSQPANQNSLLWLFGVQADQEMEIRTKSTRIVPHAITESIKSVMARNAVNLRVPQGTGLIQAGDRTVLAAFPYRHGRVVVASFGQWFMPSPFFSPDQEARRGHWTYGLTRENLPVERGPQRELPLLASVVRWLTAPRPDDEQLQDRCKPFVEALAASLRVQFNVAPRETLKDPLTKLVAEAPGGVWKEEALWTAGEASLRWIYLGAQIVGKPTYSSIIGNQTYTFPRAEGPPQTVPEYYERLVAEFPQSPLRPLAQWRLAECLRRQAVAEHYKIDQAIMFGDQRQSIPPFEKVDAPKGTYPWAWARLSIGMIYAHCGSPWERAAPLRGKGAAPFREVAEAMPTGPEKSIALLGLGFALEDDKAAWDEAARYYQAALAAPDNSWHIDYYNGGWGAVMRFRRQGPDTTHKVADDGLTALRRAAAK